MDLNECISYKHDNLYIRLIEKNDLETIRQHRNDMTTWVNLTDINLIYKEQQEVWYQSLILDKSKRYFMVDSWTDRNEGYPVFTKECIGIIRIDEIDYINRSVRVGCDIFKMYRNKGFGKKVMELVTKYCFDFLNSHRLWLLVADFNLPAIEIYKNAGFKMEGKQFSAIYREGKYHDYIMMSNISKR